MAIIQSTPSGEYQVKTGDTLSRIASQQGRTLAELLASNPQYAANPNLIHPGDVIKFGSNAQPSYSNLPGVTPPAIVHLPDQSSAQPSQPAPVSPQGPMSMNDILTQIFKSSQNQYTGNQAALLGGQEAIDKTSANTYSQDLANANITNEARLSLLGQADSLQNPALRSIESQQKMNEARFESTNEQINRAQDAYDKEQDRIAQAKSDLADAQYKQQMLAETIRSNKASEGIASQKASGGGEGSMFGSAKLTTGQKNDLADMLVLQKQIGTLNELKDKLGGYKGAGGLQSIFGGGAVTSIFGTREGAQDIRNNIGQIKGFIAKLRGGTSFTPNEQKLLDTYTPKIGDSDGVIESKLSSLNQYINDKIESTMLVAGGSYTPSDTGGEIVIGPDGQDYQIID